MEVEVWEAEMTVDECEARSSGGRMELGGISWGKRIGGADTGGGRG